MGLHKDLTGDDLHVNKLHAATHAPGGTDPLVLAGSQVTDLAADLNSLRPFSAPVAPIVVDVPSSIDATGVTDVYAALQAFIDGVEDGTLINFPAAAVYRITHGILLYARHHLIFDGHGCTLKYTSVTGTSRDYSFFSDWAVAGSDIWYKNFVLIGSSPYPGVYTPGDSPTGGEGQMGVVVMSDRVEVSGCTISAVWGDGFYLTGVISPASEGPTDVWIHDNHVISCGRNGISVISASNVIAERNVFDTCGFHAFDIEPNVATDAVYNIIFRNNTIETYHLAGGTSFFAADSTAGAVIDRVVVDGNIVTADPIKTFVQSVGAVRIKRITVTNNTGMVATSGPVLTFSNVDGLMANGNSQSLSSGVLTSIINCTALSMIDDAAAVLFLLALMRHGGALTNLITNGEFETDTTGCTGGGDATISRETGSPLVGTGSLKILYTAGAWGETYIEFGAIAGHQYLVTCRAKSTAAGGRLAGFSSEGGLSIAESLVDCSTEKTITLVGTASGGSVYHKMRLVSPQAGEYLIVDSVVCYDLSA